MGLGRLKSATAKETVMTMTKLADVVETTAIRPFQVNVPDAELTELRRRITATRFPEKETVTDFSQGVTLATTQKLARYWASEYDWRKVEARLNAVPNFITEIDGLDIHFIHVRSKHEMPCLCSSRTAGRAPSWSSSSSSSRSPIRPRMAARLPMPSTL
jgi:hypothetical protein